MKRTAQIILLVSWLLCSWLGIQAVHELGHVLAAYATGGTAERVVLHPLAISRTDVSPNSHPLAVAWAGPIVGSLLPLAAVGLFHYLHLPGRSYADFFAGFALIANGAYIGVGSFDAIGDAGEMLRHGSPAWTLWAFGVGASGVGLWLWHRVSGEFGFGQSSRSVATREAVTAALVAATATTLLALCGRR